MTRVIGVRFREAGKIYYFSPGKLEIKAGEHVIVETARGIEFGFVVLGSRDVDDSKVVQPLKTVIRMANKDDEAREENNKVKEKEAFRICKEKIRKHGLEMKLDTEATTTDQILPLVKAELGLAFIPQPMADQAIRRHEIVQICLNEEIPRRDICMVYDVKRPMSVAAKKLKKILLEERDNLDGEN